MAYVDNTKLMEALLASHEQGSVTAECYSMLESICKQRIYLYLKYDVKRHYDAMLCKCIDKCLKVWTNFRFENNNAFAYFVTIIDNTIKLYFMQNDAKFVSIEEQEARYAESD